MLTVSGGVHREREQFEAELKELKRRFETLDLNHTALTREKNTLSKEVLLPHMYRNKCPFECTVFYSAFDFFLFLSSRWQRCSSQ